MSSLQLVNPHAESVKRATALMINVNAAKGLQEVMKTNLGKRSHYFLKSATFDLKYI